MKKIYGFHERYLCELCGAVFDDIEKFKDHCIIEHYLRGDSND